MSSASVGGCALAKVARNLDGMDPDCIFAWGEGLGGGVALAVSALDERGLACTAVANPLPGGLEALSSRVRGSVLMGTSLMDAASDPKGQFAVFNGLECNRRHIIYAKYAHERINRSKTKSSTSLTKRSTVFFGLDGLDTANKSGWHRVARQTTKEILVATQKFTGVIPPVVVPDTEDRPARRCLL